MVRTPLDLQYTSLARVGDSGNHFIVSVTVQLLDTRTNIMK